jgi:hypothetical protein
MQPACTAYADSQPPQPWVLGSDIAVGQYVECTARYTVTDSDLQQATLASGGAIQVQLSVSVQASVGQILGPINSTAGALVQVLAEPGLAVQMDATKCTVGESMLKFSKCKLERVVHRTAQSTMLLRACADRLLLFTCACRRLAV